MGVLRTAAGGTAALLTVAGLVTGAGIVLSTTAEARDATVTAKAPLNVRSGPSTKYSVLGSVSPGKKLEVTGNTQGGWVPVKFAGKKAWVSVDYVRITDDDTPVKGAPAVKTTLMWGSTALNVRTSPSASGTVIVVTGKGYGFAVTSEKKSGYSKVIYQGRVAWVSTRYLTTTKPGTSTPKPSKPSSEPTPKPSSKPTSSKPSSKPTTSAPKTSVGYATTELMIRTSSSASFKKIVDVPKGTKLALTGVVKNGTAQVWYGNALRWVNATYVSSTKPTGPSDTFTLPKVTGYKYATAALDIRSSSKNSFTYSEVPKGTKLAVTGVVKDGRAQIVYNKAIRWVTAQYLSSTPPKASSTGNSSGLSGLQPEAKYLLARLQAEFPEVRTYYGVRADPIPDHPSGHAIDAMLPSYNSAAGRALGKRIANWVRANARELDVEYIIYDQHIWNIRRDSEGWRAMADRGGDTANHRDHVHITVF